MHSSERFGLPSSLFFFYFLLPGFFFFLLFHSWMGVNAFYSAVRFEAGIVGAYLLYEAGYRD